jgi:hypothetical protein
MATLTIEPTGTEAPTDPVRRQRFAILAVAITLTAIAAVVLGALWPSPSSGDWYHYADIAPIRDRWWIVLTLTAIGALINVPAQAVAALSLCRRRGSAWATWGGVAMWVGIAMEASAAAGWAATYYFVTDPALDPTAGTALLNHITDDPRLMTVGMTGTLLAALGTVAQAVGLLRARAIPRWLPVVSLVIVLSFLLPNNGPASVITSLPGAVASIGIGVYAWRRAR